MKKFTKIILMATLMTAPTFSATLPGMNIEGELEVEGNTTTKVTGDLHVYGSITGSGTLDFTDNPTKKVLLHGGEDITDASDSIKEAIQAYHDENLSDQTLGNIYMNGSYSGTIADTVTIKNGETSKTYAELKTTPDTNLVDNVSDESFNRLFEAGASDVVQLVPDKYGYLTITGGASSAEVKTINCMLSDLQIDGVTTCSGVTLLGNLNLSGRADYFGGTLTRLIVGGKSGNDYAIVTATSSEAMPQEQIMIRHGALVLRNGNYKTSKDITLLHGLDVNPALIVEEGSSLTISKGTKLKVEYSAGG